MRTPTIVAVTTVAWLFAGAVEAQCAGLSEGDACEDGQYCSVGETCDAALLCQGGRPRVCSDDRACTRDVCDETANACQFLDAPAGTPCSDGRVCTVDDMCTGDGACVGGPLRACDDGLDCTVDSCNIVTDRCDSVVSSGCVIFGWCVDVLARSEADRCRACVPSVSRSAWTQLTGHESCGAPSCEGGVLAMEPTCDDTGACVASGVVTCPTGVCRDELSCVECVDGGTGMCRGKDGGGGDGGPPGEGGLRPIDGDAPLFDGGATIRAHGSGFCSAAPVTSDGRGRPIGLLPIMVLALGVGRRRR